MPHKDPEDRKRYERERYARLNAEKDPRAETKRTNSAAWAAANRDRKNESHRAWYDRNTEKARAVAKAQRVRSKEYAREIRRQYGLTKEDYDKRVTEVGGRCEICGNAADLSVDHCHDSLFVRGLLCMHCNTALGHFRDSIPNLVAALRYLRRARRELPTNEFALEFKREPPRRLIAFFIKGYTRRGLTEMQCLHCGETFKAFRRDARYCSRQCSEDRNNGK